MLKASLGSRDSHFEQRAGEKTLLKNSSRVLSDDDREALDEMLESVDRMTDRITNLEAILDADHPDWRNDKETNR